MTDSDSDTALAFGAGGTRAARTTLPSPAIPAATASQTAAIVTP